MPKPLTILGISPGTRTIGIAIWKDNLLAEWQMKAFKGVWGEGKLRNILYTIKEIIEQYGINCIGIKVPTTFHSSPGLDKLYIELQSLCRTLNIRVKPITLSELKKFGKNDTTTSKADLIRAIADQNHALRILYNREMKNKNPYYTKMFEAIGLTLFVYDQYCKSHKFS